MMPRSEEAKNIKESLQKLTAERKAVNDQLQKAINQFSEEAKNIEESLQKLTAEHKAVNDQLQKTINQFSVKFKPISDGTKSFNIAPQNLAGSSEFIESIRTHLALHTEYLSLEEKFEKVSAQTKKADDYLELLNKAADDVDNALSTKEQDEKAIKLKMSAMEAANDAFRHEFKVLKAVLPIPSYHCLRDKVDALHKELSSQELAEGITDDYSELLTLGKNACSIILRAVDLRITSVDPHKKMITQIQTRAKAIAILCQSLIDRSSLAIIVKELRNWVACGRRIIAIQEEENARQMQDIIRSLSKMPPAIEAKKQFIIDELEKFIKSGGNRVSSDLLAKIVPHYNSIAEHLNVTPPKTVSATPAVTQVRERISSETNLGDSPSRDSADRHSPSSSPSSSVNRSASNNDALGYGSVSPRMYKTPAKQEPQPITLAPEKKACCIAM